MPQLDTIHTFTNFIIMWSSTMLMTKKTQNITMNSMMKKSPHNMKSKSTWTLPWT